MDYMTIGKNIKQCRKALGLKQDELAELAEMSTSYCGVLAKAEKMTQPSTITAPSKQTAA